jgi:hypothetical protein
MFDSHPKVFDCVCKIVPTKKHRKPVTTHQGEYEPPCMFFFAFAGSQELHDIKIQQVREAEAQATNNTFSLSRDPLF